MVAFPDIPEALTDGPTREQALEMAADALITAMDFYFEDRRHVPPSEPKRGHELVELPASVSAKVRLLNEMLAQGVRASELARRMNVPPHEVSRLTNLHHVTKIDRIAEALQAMGKRLELIMARF